MLHQDEDNSVKVEGDDLQRHMTLVHSERRHKISWNSSNHLAENPTCAATWAGHVIFPVIASE